MKSWKKVNYHTFRPYSEGEKNVVKYKYDGLKTVEEWKEVYRESILERDEIIARYHKALEQGLEITKNSNNKWLNIIKDINENALKQD